jgi:predicted AAA+ superfamily ATPase
VHNSQIFEDLLKLLAHQIGQLVSVNELALSLGTSRTTIIKYLRLLEQSYIIIRLRSFVRNHRNELKKAFKIFFIDTGIRNAIIDAFNTPFDNRNDKGVLFENFYILEHLKKGATQAFPPQLYFWRTDTKMEIDLVITSGDGINAYECKWSSQPVSFKLFLKAYPHAQTRVVTPEDILEDE